MTTKTKALITRLETAKKLVARDRDFLRDLRAEVEDLEGSCERAVDSLDEAIGALSELV